MSDKEMQAFHDFLIYQTHKRELLLSSVFSVDPEGVEPSSDSNAQRNSFTGLVAFSKTTNFGAFLFWDDLMLSQCTLQYEPDFRFGLKEDQTPPAPFCSKVSATRWLSCYCKLYLFNHRDNFRSSID